MKQESWKRGGSKGTDVLAEELAIWIVIGVSLLLVALMLLRGDGAPRIGD